MIYRYVPILRLKRGERTGVAQLSAAGKTDVTPLFAIDPAQYRARAGANPLTAAQHLVLEISQCWGAQPFYLDASSLAIPAGSISHPLLDIATAARAAGLHLVPATTVFAWASYQTAVQAVMAADGYGVALRVDLQTLTTAGSWAPQITTPLSEIDLVADFSNNVGNVAALGASLDHAFMNLHAAGAWRSVTIAGTSMPDNFSGYSAGAFSIPRTELFLWTRIANLGLSYRVDYGDYATVPVNAPPSGIKWGFPINVKYTRETDFLICRGVGTTGVAGVDMDVQLRGHAQTIVAAPHRAPLTHCWADGQIDAIAAGAVGPGNLEAWVRLGVNRHVERVRASLP